MKIHFDLTLVDKLLQEQMKKPKRIVNNATLQRNLLRKITIRLSRQTNALAQLGEECARTERMLESLREKMDNNQ